MEIVPLLEKNYSEKRRKQLHEEKIILLHHVITSVLPKEALYKTIAYMQKLYEQDKKIKIVKIGAPILKEQGDWLHREELRRKMMQCSERWPAIKGGAGWGGFFGCTLGCDGAGLYYFGDGCVRCCCMKSISFMSTSLMNKIMCYTVSGCTCAGCAIGAFCVATGLSKDIDHYFA